MSENINLEYHINEQLIDLVFHLNINIDIKVNFIIDEKRKELTREFGSFTTG